MKHHRKFAFAVAATFGTLGGMMGLGGSEFRLPALVGPLGYGPRAAVPINLMVSLATVSAALPARSTAVPLDQVLAHLPAMIAMAGGAMLAAYGGAGLLKRLPEARLIKILTWLLVALGLLLLVESVLPSEFPALVPDVAWARVVVGIAAGLVIGLVSSLLGVAGGELIIPTLVLAFGVPIKLAGSMSLMISLPTILVGLARYARAGLLSERAAWRDTIAPMSIGSMLGAVAGGLLIGLIPSDLLKVAMGCILIWSASHIGRH